MDPKLTKKEVREDIKVRSARNRFKNVLKHMVQDNLMKEENNDSDPDESRMSNSERKSKKNGKVDLFVDPPKQPQSFLMKLFNRDVDLADFDGNTSLYPICRAWIQNKANVNVCRNKEDIETRATNDNLEETDDIYNLPPPDKLPNDESGNQICIRVPPPLDRADEHFDINNSDDSSPDPASLFLNHLDRWNVIRQRWREAGAYNERRYERSLAVIRQIHEVNATPPST